MASKNIICKQTISFQYNGNVDGFALQKEVSDWCKFTLIPGIEKELEPFALADDYITIDKLVIDAAIDKDDWQQKIRNELISGLSKKLVNYKPVLKAQAAGKSEAISIKLDELILFFFEKGFLPWWENAMMSGNFEMLLNNWVNEEIPEKRAAEISRRLILINKKPVIERIINHLPSSLYFRFIKNVFKKSSEAINETESFINEIITGKISKAAKVAFTKPVFGFILDMMISNRAVIDTARLLEFIYEELKMYKAAEKILKPLVYPAVQIKTPLKKEWEDLLIKKNKTKENKNAALLTKEKKLKYNKTIDELTQESAEENHITDLAGITQQGIYIENAGAVIFAAFIPALFEKLKISKEQTIVNSNLAVMLIQYAVTGNTKMEEHELVLSKILCGIDLELPVNTNSRITAAQRKEADEMLSSVIEYWAVIKDTSIPGLRASFLQRSGKLSMNNKGWLLQVEQRPYDMLLQQLPWSISMIKLPWMNYLLKTEWV